MKLYGTNTSPYVRKVRLVLLEKISLILIKSMSPASLTAWLIALIPWAVFLHSYWMMKPESMGSVSHGTRLRKNIH